VGGGDIQEDGKMETRASVVGGCPILCKLSELLVLLVL